MRTRILNHFMLAPLTSQDDIEQFFVSEFSFASRNAFYMKAILDSENVLLSKSTDISKRQSCPEITEEYSGEVRDNRKKRRLKFRTEFLSNLRNICIFSLISLNKIFMEVPKVGF